MGFIQSRDSFYMATVSETGWLYVQHRGGKPGFLRVINPTSLAFADYKGNRQLLSTGNLAVTDRVTLFLMDYPQRTRLKILGHARVEMRDSIPNLSRNSPSRKSSALWNGCFSSRLFPSIGTVRNTSPRDTPPQKGKLRLLR